MKAIFLTGYISGLGKEIHDLLVNESNYELFFIGRSSVLESIDNRHYLKVDFASENYNWINCFKFDSYDFSDVILINNAATIEPIGNIEDYLISEMEESMKVNFLSPICLIQKLKTVSQSIKIINITSGAAQKAVSSWAGYCSSKAAMKMFLDVLEYEHGVTVSHIDPGVMDTKMQETIRQKADRYKHLKGFVEIYNSGKLNKPKDVAKSIISLIN